MKRFEVVSEEQLSGVAQQVIPFLDTNNIVCFDGEMGAGKTTFIKAICRELGVEDAMSSPTFSIVNEYRDDQNASIYHFDFYRLDHPEEALDIGVEEYFYSGDLCLIEWPEKIKGLIPEQHLEISIKLGEGNSREIIVKRNS